jgi:hypothetical protein
MNQSDTHQDPFGSQPITEWMRGHLQGDTLMQHRLWKAVSDILINYTKKQLEGKPNLDGPEGIVNEAFFQLLKGLEEDKFRTMTNRHDLLQMLYTLCARRAEDSLRRENAQKRGGGRIVPIDNPSDVEDRSGSWNPGDQIAEELILEESFQELLTLVIKRYRNRPEVDIFKYAYMSGMTDRAIANRPVKDEAGKPMEEQEIRRRRKAVLAYLKRQSGNEE